MRFARTETNPRDRACSLLRDRGRGELPYRERPGQLVKQLGRQALQVVRADHKECIPVAGEQLPSALGSLRADDAWLYWRDESPASSTGKFGHGDGEGQCPVHVGNYRMAAPHRLWWRTLTAQVRRHILGVLSRVSHLPTCALVCAAVTRERIAAKFPQLLNSNARPLCIAAHELLFRHLLSLASPEVVNVHPRDEQRQCEEPAEAKNSGGEHDEHSFGLSHRVQCGQMAGSDPAAGAMSRVSGMGEQAPESPGQIMCVSPWPSAVTIHAASASEIIA